MVDYAIIDKVIGPNDPITVAAELETYLETIDSTTNAIVDLSYVKSGSDSVTAILLHLG